MSLEVMSLLILHSVLLAMVAYLVPASGDVIMTTKYEGNKDYACMEETIVVKCSVTGISLRWIIVDTSLKMLNKDRVTLLANVNDVGLSDSITTSTIVLSFYQNETVQNTAIASELHFAFKANDFVLVSCTDQNLMSDERNITVLRKTDTPSDLNVTYNAIVTTNSMHLHIVEWTMTNKERLKEYVLTTMMNGSSNETFVNKSSIHRDALTHYYMESNLGIVTAEIVSINLCGQESDKAYFEPPSSDMEQHSSNDVGQHSSSDMQVPIWAVAPLVIGGVGTGWIVLIPFCVFYKVKKRSRENTKE